MGILAKISNRHLLVGLVGLGVLNALLCLMYMMREKSNATEIVKLTNDLELASKKHEDRAQILAGELARTQEELIQTRRSLSQTIQKLDATQTTLATYQGKPWLAKSGKSAPWAALDDRLGQVEKTLKDNKLVPSDGEK